MSKLDIIMIVGPSSTGKTHLAKEIAETAVQRTVAVNDRAEESPFADKVLWRDIGSLKDCSLVIEDLIALSRPQLEQIKEVLNFKAHHHHISPVVLVTHTIVANGMTQFLPFVTKLIFAASPGCVSSVKRALGQFGFSKDEIEKHLKDFKGGFAAFKFFELGVNSRTFLPCGNSSKPDPGSQTRSIVATAQTLFRHLQDPTMAETIFHMIFPHLPKTNFSRDDLSVTMKGEKSGREMKISIVDYIDHLTDENKSVDREMLSFHRFVKRHVLIPESFIKNRKFMDE